MQTQIEILLAIQNQGLNYIEYLRSLPFGGGFSEVDLVFMRHESLSFTQSEESHKRTKGKKNPPQYSEEIKGQLMINKKNVALKISRGDFVSSQDVVDLLRSKWEMYKSFGIKGTINNPNPVYRTELKSLCNDKNEIVASSALEALGEIDPQTAIEISKQKLKSPGRFLQAAALYILATNRAQDSLKDIQTTAKKYAHNNWRQLGFLEALYQLDGNKDQYLKQIFDIVNKTRDYHVQCSGLNILQRILTNNNHSSIKDFIGQFEKRDLPESVRSTLAAAKTALFSRKELKDPKVRT